MNVDRTAPLSLQLMDIQPILSTSLIHALERNKENVSGMEIFVPIFK